MNTVIIDSDALIGLIHQADALHHRSVQAFKYLKGEDFNLFIPYPILLEAATALSRIVGRSDLAAQILHGFSSFKDEIDTNVAEMVAKLYDPETSKKNTPFDYYVLALAKKNNIKYVFSFDSFYKKNGLILIEDVIS